MRPAAVERYSESLKDEIDRMSKLGEGTYGDVYDGVRLRDMDPKWREGIDPGVLPSGFGSAGERVAVKIIKPHRDGEVPVLTSVSTLREIKLLRELHHPNLIFLEQVILHPGLPMPELAIIFERADFDLRRLIRHERGLLNDFTIKSIMYQMLLGVNFLHESWVVHRDLKPQNVLIAREAGLAKIGDFGLARIFQAPVRAMAQVERVVVTLWYRAPELLLGAKHYTTAVDVWALGCMFAEMILGHELFCGKEDSTRGAPFQADQCDRIFRVLSLPSTATWPSVGQLPHYQRVDAWRSEKVYPTESTLDRALQLPRHSARFDLVARMLTMDPDRRITAREALDHPYFVESPRPGGNCFDSSTAGSYSREAAESAPASSLVQPAKRARR